MYSISNVLHLEIPLCGFLCGSNGIEHKIMEFLSGKDYYLIGARRKVL